MQGKGRESGTLRPSDKDVDAEADHLRTARRTYLAKAAADDATIPIALQAIARSLRSGQRHAPRRSSETRVEAEPRHLDALLKFAARAYRRPLTQAERDDLLAYYRTLREKNSLTHEEAIRDSIVSVLMSPDFCYRIDLSRRRRRSRRPAAAGARGPRRSLSPTRWPAG